MNAQTIEERRAQSIQWLPMARARLKDKAAKLQSARQEWDVYPQSGVVLGRVRRAESARRGEVEHVAELQREMKRNQNSRCDL